jgi:oligopeptide/dipeptide ABC transporter ATP-binding protein
MKLLEVRGLRVRFSTRRGGFAAVDGVDLDVAAGETLCLVGESACGKSTACVALMRLLPPNATLEGSVVLDGRDLLALGEREMDEVRGRDVAMVFQDPMASLNPVHTIGGQIAEVLILHRGMSRDAAGKESRRLLDLVGIPDAGRRAGEYPHQLSGGMNQRASIAMALAGRPKLLIADEPTTALDVTIQAQILDLLRALRKEMGMALILVTHDLGVVAEMADRVAVMYAGRVIETAPVADVFASPRHPYTRGLLASIPRLDGPIGRLRTIEGGVPDPEAPDPGCRFAPRCAEAIERCRTTRPALASVALARASACLRDAEIAA